MADSKPNWLKLLMSQQGLLRKVMLGLGLGLVAVICLGLIQGETPVRVRAAVRQGAHLKKPPGQLASRDIALTGIARSNKLRALQAAEQITALQSQVALLQRQIEVGGDKKSAPTLTPEQVRQIASQQIALSTQARPVMTLPPAPAWQRVGPAKPPVQAAAPIVTPKWVTIPAGSTAKATLSDGMAWIADRSTRYHTMRIEGIHTPNNKEIPLGDCHVVMQSELSIASEVVARVPVTGDVLSCVLPNGEAIEVEFKGYAATSDNVQGLETKVFSNDLDILKEFGKAAIPAALARAIDGVSRIATTPLGTVSQRSGSALSDAFSAMSDFYLDNARVYARKVLWINPHQDLYVYFRRAVQLKGVTPQLLTASTGFNRKAFN